VQASRARILEAADDARRCIERDLHDGAQQRLLRLSMLLSAACERASRDPELETMLAQAVQETRNTLSELRELAQGILPAALRETGLRGALQSLAERSPVPAALCEVPPDRFEDVVESTAYFVVSEALANTAKHARAGSVAIRVTSRPGRLLVEVRDDGVGGAQPGRGSGLSGLADRIASLGGSLHLDSPPGRGTCLLAELPCR
jgi:signal transduction histidine kinase